MIKNIIIAIFSLILAGCGYGWYFTYDRIANASLDGNVEVSSNEAIKTYLSDFAANGEYKFIDQKIAVPSQDAISLYLERKDVLISATTVPNGDWLNVGFYKSKQKKYRPDDATLNQLVNAITDGLGSIDGVKIVEKNLPE